MEPPLDLGGSASPRYRPAALGANPRPPAVSRAVRGWALAMGMVLTLVSAPRLVMAEAAPAVAAAETVKPDLPSPAALASAVVAQDAQTFGTAAPADEPVTKKWWFWATVGGVVVATAVIIIVASRAPEAPDTRLGNMEAFRGR